MRDQTRDVSLDFGMGGNKRTRQIRPGEVQTKTWLLNEGSHSNTFLWLATNFATNNLTAAFYGRYFCNMMSQGSKLWQFSASVPLLVTPNRTLSRTRDIRVHNSPKWWSLSQSMLWLSEASAFSGIIAEKQVTLLSSQNDTVTCCILNTQCVESTYHQDFARNKTYCPPCYVKQCSIECASIVSSLTSGPCL